MADTDTHIAVYCPDVSNRANWIARLRSALPASFTIDDQPTEQTRYAVVWSPPADFFEQSPALSACFSMGAGVDHLVQHPGLAPSVPLYRLEDAGMGIQMARYCRHEVEHYRLMHYRYQTQQVARQWIEHQPKPPAATPVGLFGYGVLGQQVAAALINEGHPVSAFRRSGDQSNQPVRVFSGTGQWVDFLSASQVLILIAPLTDQTRGVINADALAALPEQAYLINVGRGALVNDTDLVQAIQGGNLAGATLDVFNSEPLPANSPYWTLPNLRITPHISAQTLLPESVNQIAKKITTLEKGQQASGLVRREQGY